jgi:hypothetical protein
LISACAAGLLAALATSAAHATLNPIDSTAANDMLDSATGLIWLKAATLQEGLDLGFHLATADEALALPIGDRLDAAVFKLGADVDTGGFNVPGTKLDYRVSIGHVAGPQGESWLAGFGFQQAQDFGTSSGQGFYLAGDAALFQTISKPMPGYPGNWQGFSHVLANGQLTQVCAMLCNGFSQDAASGIWGRALQATSASGPGYFMVRGAVPEASTAAMLGLGLIGLAATARLRRRA